MIKLTGLILFGIIMFTLGYTLTFYLVMHNVFSKQEIMEAHGSFDQRLNLLDERISIIEDSTRSGTVKIRKE